jgi:alcohol dehydrogenase (cytochrome c)
MPGTYDPDLNTLYWGTGNAAPDYDGSVRPGDDLYTASLLAIDPDTGKLKWYFQFTPHDLYDYDGAETPVLVDMQYQGKPRKLLIEANRNGFIYLLDRTNGQFLSATPFAKKINWATGMDANGRPMVTDLKPTPDGTLICPGVVGANSAGGSGDLAKLGGISIFRVIEASINPMDPRPLPTTFGALPQLL